MNIIGYKLFRVTRLLRSVFYTYYNRIWFSAMGIEYGRNMIINNKIYISGFGKIRIGNDFRFSSGDSINPISRNLRGAFYLGTPQASIIIGDEVGMSSTCLWANERIEIGNHVNIGGDCIIMDNDAHPHDFTTRRRDYCRKTGVEFTNIIPTEPVIVEDDAWIGARCIILKGVRIGARSIIAAGSVVTKDIPSDCVAGGNPCSVIRFCGV